MSSNRESTFMNRLRFFFPVIDWLQTYNRQKGRGDLQAGLTVGVMLIPQGMAYAVLAGLPPIYGLYASLVPLLIYPLLGTSRHLSVGIVAIDMLIVATGVRNLGLEGGEFIAATVLITALVGVIQILLSAVRLGFLVNFLSRPVIVGFTTAAPLIIAGSQLGNLFGIEMPNSEYIHVLLWNLVLHIDQVHLLTLGIGAASLLLLQLLKIWKPMFPRALFVVIVSMVSVALLQLDKQGLEVVGEIPAGLPTFRLPGGSFSLIRDLLPTIITLALVQFMSVVSLGKVFASRKGYAINPNKELLAVGMANLFGSAFRSPPVSGSFSRSAVNVQAGGNTALSNIFAAAVIGITLVFLTPYFYYLPMTVLAAIIIMAAIGLIDVQEIRYLFTTKTRDGIVAMLTFLTTLLIGIQEGILLGIGTSLVAEIYRMSRPNIAILGHMPGSRSFRDITKHSRAIPIHGVLIVRVDASFSFANAEYLKDFVLEKSEYDAGSIRAVIIDGSSINDVDTTAIEALESIVKQLSEWNIEFYLTGLKSPVREVVVKSGFKELIGENHLFMTPHRAIKDVLKAWDEEMGDEDYPRLNAYLEQAGN